MSKDTVTSSDKRVELLWFLAWISDREDVDLVSWDGVYPVQLSWSKMKELADLYLEKS